MNTQELKQYIDKVLGNNIRCLLPSYWWKRLFNQVADRIDEVEQSTSKLIDSKIEEVKMPIVESVDELSKLDLPKGSVAAIKDLVCSFKDLYRLTEEDFDDIFSSIKKMSRIERIAVKPYVGVPKDFSSCMCVLISRSLTSQITFIVESQGDTLQVSYLETTNSEAGLIKLHNSDGSINKEAEEQLNSILKEREYLFVGNQNGPTTDEEYEVLDSLFTIWEASDLYIKGASWERLAKENDINITFDTELSKTSKNAVQNKVIAEEFDKQQCVFVVGSDGTAPENYKQQNIESYNKVYESIEADRWMNVFVRYSAYFRIQVDSITISGGNELVLYATFDDSFIEFRVSSDGSVVTQNSGSLTIDTSLSTTSINAVQNKVITAALNNKVDKVNGKQLSTEDFTSVLRTKLEGLRNYDDTSIQNAINSLTTQINTLVSSDASTAIESFNEITAFLSGIEDSESLDSIIAAIEQQIAAKQDKLVSGTNIKTINGESILGEGNIVVNVDTSNLATKEELNAKQDVIEDLETIRSGAAKGATALQEHQDISHLATKEELTNLTNEMVANEEVHAAAYNDLNTRLNELSENVQGETVTKKEFNVAIEGVNNGISTKQDVLVSGTNIKTINNESILGSGNIEINVDTSSLASKEELQNLQNEVIANEEVHAAAYNDLNSRLAALEAALLNINQ